MLQVRVDHWIEDFIRAHARTSSKEIYGWLVGHETAAGDLLVVSAIGCERYTAQHEVGARPDVREIQELASAMPQGIGFVGIYHSHPGEVFHSATDDETALNMARLYPNVLSAVSNGSIIKWYRHDGGRKFSEFEPARAIDAGGRIQLVRAEASIDYSVFVDPNMPVIPQVSSALIDGFRAAWQEATVEFCRVDGASSSSDSSTIPIDMLARRAARGLKPGKHARVLDLASKNLKFADERAIVTVVHLRLSGGGGVAPPGTTRVAGTLSLDGILGNVAGTIDAAVFTRQLEAELLDDLMVKSAKAVAVDENGQIRIEPPRTYYIPYLAIPLKLRVHAAGRRNDVDDPARIARERDALAAMVRRAEGMFSAGRLALGRAMASTLREVASALADKGLTLRCDTLLARATGEGGP